VKPGDCPFPRLVAPVFGVVSLSYLRRDHPPSVSGVRSRASLLPAKELMSDLVAREVSVEPCTRAVTGVRRAEVDAMEAISLNLEMRHVTQNLGYQPKLRRSLHHVARPT
jgi:hypothetical protein